MDNSEYARIRATDPNLFDFWESSPPVLGCACISDEACMCALVRYRDDGETIEDARYFPVLRVSVEENIGRSDKTLDDWANILSKKFSEGGSEEPMNRKKMKPMFNPR